MPIYHNGQRVNPIVQMFDERISGTVGDNSTGFKDIKILKTFTPKISGSKIHVFMFCQTWHPSTSEGPSTDTYGRLLHNNSGSYAVFTENDRIQGNFNYDERFHHSGISIMGSFTTANTNSTSVKFQASMGTTLNATFDYFHAYGGRFRLIEYDVT